MIGKGTFKFEKGGKTVGFKFGTLAAAYTEAVAKCSITEVFQRIHGFKVNYDDTGKVLDTIAIPGLSRMALLHYFYGGAVAYSGNESLTVSEVADQIDLIGEDNAFRVFAESLETYVPKKNEPKKEKVKGKKKTGG